MALETVISSLTDGIKNSINAIPKEMQKQLNEIRVRRNMPLVLVFGKACLFITENGKLLNHYSSSVYRVEADEFDVLFRRLSNYSVHSAIDNLTKGFITANGGNRVGVSSTAVIKDKNISSVKDVTSLNIRISNEIKDCARPILNLLYVNRFPSIIVASPPSGGKTTFLRDFSRLLSGGFNNKYRKVAIIDERNEIAYKNNGEIDADIGFNTDVLTGFPKSDGIEIAVRTLSPDIIVCDEISKTEEAMAIADGFHSGVKFAVSVHAASKYELINKSIVRQLIEYNEFEYIVLLNDYTDDFEITEVSELKDEIFRANIAEYRFNCGGL